MIYVASVYSLNAKGTTFEDMKIRDRRYRYVMKKTHDLATTGNFPYSPIVSFHEMSLEYEMPKEYKFYRDFDRHMISKSEMMIVLRMDGWEESEGITDEIAYAKSIGVPIVYFKCLDYKDFK